MAEQQDGKEDKYEFDPAGETQGYISLEEARVQAIEHARDNLDFYAPRYRTAALVWEVETASETEDNYEIRLSFRPGNVAGDRAGLEQFILDKTGQLRVRQILRQPRGGRSVLSLTLAAGGIVALAIAAMAVLFSTGVLLPQAESEFTQVAVPISPSQSSLLVSPQDRVRVDMEVGAVDRPVKLRYRTATLEQGALRPSGLIPDSPIFDLSVEGESGAEGEKFTFNTPVTLSVKIPDGAEHLAGGVASNIVIQHYSSEDDDWTELPTSIDFQVSMAKAQIKSLSLFALTVREPPPQARVVPIAPPRPVQGYAGQGFARLTSPEQLPQGGEALVSLEVALIEPLTVDEIRFVSLQSEDRRVENTARTASRPSMRVERYDDVPVYSRMKAELAGKSFRITQLEPPEVSLINGMAKWNWEITPRQGATGSYRIAISLSANGRTYRTLEGAIIVAVAEEPTVQPTGTPIPTDTPAPVPIRTPVIRVPTKPAEIPEPTAVPVPTALPVPLETPTPDPFDTPSPVQEWRLEDVLVAGDKVTVLIRVLGPGWFNTTLDGIATEETVIDGTLRADVFRNVPPGSHTVRVFTVGVPGQEEVRGLKIMQPTPTFPPTATPSGPATPTPIPRYRMFINGVAAPALVSLMQTDAGSVTLSPTAESDGYYKIGTEVVLLAGLAPGLVLTWEGVDTQRGVFATVEMVADRHVAVRMTPPTPTPEPTRTPFPWEIPTPTPVPTAIPVPTPIPVPTATPVEVGPTPTPLPPTPTHTPQPPGEPTHTPTPPPTPTPTPTPTATPVPSFTLTTSASPAEGGTVSPSGANSYLVDTQVPVTASPNTGYGFTVWSGDCTGSSSCLVTMDADKAVTAGFQLMPTPTPVPEAPGGKIAFVAGRDGNFEIYSMDADGSNQTRLTNASGTDESPNWSPSGGKIAFGSYRGGNSEIYVMNSDGSGQTNLTNHASENVEPEWSPNGTKIAFGSDRDGNWEIYVMDSDGSNQTRITNNPAVDSSPTWSSDGSKIAFRTNRDGNYEVYSMNSDGSGQIRLTNNSLTDTSPSWSPIENKIAFLSNRDGNWEIYTMNTDGSNQVNLTNSPSSDANAGWSPDGSSLVYNSDQDSGEPEVYTMNADGTYQLRLTNNGSADMVPDWGP